MRSPGSDTASSRMRMCPSSGAECMEWDKKEKGQVAGDGQNGRKTFLKVQPAMFCKQLAQILATVH
jgi:hypothetical protein